MCLVFLIAVHVITRMLFDKIYPTQGMTMWVKVDCKWLVDVMLDATKFSLMNSGLKLALNTTLVVRVQWLIKWASHLTSKVRKPPDHHYMFY